MTLPGDPAYSGLPLFPRSDGVDDLVFTDPLPTFSGITVEEPNGDITGRLVAPVGDKSGNTDRILFAGAIFRQDYIGIFKPLIGYRP